MGSIRVYTLAKELGIDNKELLAYLKKFKISVKSHMSNIDAETAELVKNEVENILKDKKQEKRKALPKIAVVFPITVRELAVKIGIKPNEAQKKLLQWKIFAHINMNVNEDIASKLAEEYGYVLEKKLTKEEEVLKVHQQEDKATSVKRPPVVTLMGHVDHGKTTLLEKIRDLELTRKEVGGITQHIGAYEVRHKNEKITFIDTPGHEAFTSMRARGANVTDIVILVVAADDGIMPQTIEAIDHAKAANVPILVAITKIDKPDANPDKVKRQLSELGLAPESWGGDIISVEVSGISGKGIDDLLDMILLQGEIMELKANPDKVAKGVVLESKITKGGPFVSVLVQSGTLKIGDILLAGACYGKVKALFDDIGNQLSFVGPADPVGILGLNGVPQAGESFLVVEDESIVRDIVAKRLQESKLKQQVPPQKMSFKDLSSGEEKVLRIILKADVSGSLDAITDSLNKLQEKHKDEIEFKMLHKGVGAVSESDVVLALASDAMIVGFHVGIDEKAKVKAKEENIEVRLYSIIYDLIKDINNVFHGLKEPELEERLLGKLEVRQVFGVTKVGKIAGGMVIKGKIQRNSFCRLLRNSKVIYEGRITSLKRFKDDAKEVAEGYECGVGLENWEDIDKNDIVEAYTMLEVKR